MDTLAAVVGDLMIYKNSVARDCPQLKDRTDGLRAVTWDGVTGRNIYADRVEEFTDPALMNEWWALWDACAPTEEVLTRSLNATGRTMP